jgi:hypothetical protein
LSVAVARRPASSPELLRRSVTRSRCRHGDGLPSTRRPPAGTPAWPLKGSWAADRRPRPTCVRGRRCRPRRRPARIGAPRDHGRRALSPTAKKAFGLRSGPAGVTTQALPGPAPSASSGSAYAFGRAAARGCPWSSVATARLALRQGGRGRLDALASRSRPGRSDGVRLRASPDT